MPQRRSTPPLIRPQTPPPRPRRAPAPGADKVRTWDARTRAAPTGCARMMPHLAPRRHAQSLRMVGCRQRSPEPASSGRAPAAALTPAGARCQPKTRAPRRCSAHLAGPASGRRCRRAARPCILRLHRRRTARCADRAGARRRRGGAVDRRPCARPRAGRGHGARARVRGGAHAVDRRDAHAHMGTALHGERNADRTLAARGGGGGGGRPMSRRRADGGRVPRARCARPRGRGAIARARLRRRRGRASLRGGAWRVLGLALRARRVPGRAFIVLLQAGGSALSPRCLSMRQIVVIWQGHRHASEAARCQPWRLGEASCRQVTHCWLPETPERAAMGAAPRIPSQRRSSRRRPRRRTARPRAPPAPPRPRRRPPPGRPRWAGHNPGPPAGPARG